MGLTDFRRQFKVHCYYYKCSRVNLKGFPHAQVTKGRLFQVALLATKTKRHQCFLHFHDIYTTLFLPLTALATRLVFSAFSL